MDRIRFIVLSAVAVQPAFASTPKLEEEIQKRLVVNLAQIKEVADIKLTAPP